MRKRHGPSPEASILHSPIPRLEEILKSWTGFQGFSVCRQLPWTRKAPGGSGGAQVNKESSPTSLRPASSSPLA